MRGCFASSAVIAGWLATAAPGVAQQPREMWLDRPLTPWNEASARLPAAPQPVRREDVQRCRIDSGPATHAVRAMTGSGWIAFLPFERVLGRGDVEVLGGMRSATEDCGPGNFNLFVFVGGVYAGTLSPVEMTTAKDGVIGTVRFPPGDVVTAEFARYGPADTECCPSGRVKVGYRIERQGSGPVVVATEVRKLR